MEEHKSSAFATPPPFSKIKHANPPCTGSMPTEAEIEWKAVKTPDDVRKWHRKWTPWFDETAIEGFVKYAYPKMVSAFGVAETVMEKARKAAEAAAEADAKEPTKK